MAPFRCAFPVRFNDVDHAGIVYYPNFYHYFHVAFEELWRARLGAQAYVRLLDEQRIGLPAVRAEAEFFAPLRFGDIAVVEVALDRLGTKSVALRYRVYREQDAEPRLRAEGVVTCACINLDAFRAVAVPRALCDVFEALGPFAGGV